MHTPGLLGQPETDGAILVLSHGQLDQLSALIGRDASHVGRVIRGERTSRTLAREIEAALGLPLAQVRLRPRQMRSDAGRPKPLPAVPPAAPRRSRRAASRRRRPA